jgi:cellulose biosynthesis protein BcsQ
MSVTVTAFFNNKGGVGKTSLVYHMAWMYARLGLRVVAADLDPQSNLTAAFLDEDMLEKFWPDGDHPSTVYGAVRPLVERSGDIAVPHVEEIDEPLALLVGDMLLSGFEDLLSQEWPKAMDGDAGSFRVLSAFWRMLRRAASDTGAELALVDLGPNLGAINRAALIAADYVVVPLAPDLFSLQGLRNLGPTLIRWREQWSRRLKEAPDNLGQELPSGRMEPVGYVVMQHSERMDRPVKAYKKWMDRIPHVYGGKVAGESEKPTIRVGEDPNCISMLKHFRSLIPLGQEARKPIFDLKAADGALGAHTYAVRDAYTAFESLAREIAKRISVNIPGDSPSDESLGQPARGFSGE